LSAAEKPKAPVYVEEGKPPPPPGEQKNGPMIQLYKVDPKTHLTDVSEQLKKHEEEDKQKAADQAAGKLPKGYVMPDAVKDKPISEEAATKKALSEIPPSGLGTTKEPFVPPKPGKPPEGNQ
jgi:hypothetical protein